MSMPTSSAERPDRLAGLRIVTLTAENVKRLKAVSIKPTGNVVEITGRNAQGKTSVLDAIWWALASASHVQPEPIRKGEEKAVIKLDMGDLVVTRTFKRKEGGFTTSILVEDAEGFRPRSPQTLLDNLVGALSFDPLEFTRMKGDDQTRILRSFVTDFDFDANQEEIDRAFQERTAVNREAKSLRAQAEAVLVPDDAPEAPVDETEIVNKISSASTTNVEIERQKTNRLHLQQAIDAKRERTGTIQADIEYREKEIARLQREIDDLQDEYASLQKEAADEQAALDGLPSLDQPVDTAALQARLREAQALNEKHATRRRRAELEAQAKAKENHSRDLTVEIEELREKARAAVRNSPMPVKGIEIVEGGVFLNGEPFEQASDAERLRASMAIAMALNPRLRVIRVRDGSLLDEDGMRLVYEMADEHKCQVWIERVDQSGKTGVVIEDGEVAAIHEAAE